jgi:hypothetical protein
LGVLKKENQLDLLSRLRGGGTNAQSKVNLDPILRIFSSKINSLGPVFASKFIFVSSSERLLSAY